MKTIKHNSVQYVPLHKAQTWEDGVHWCLALPSEFFIRFVLEFTFQKSWGWFWQNVVHSFPVSRAVNLEGQTPKTSLSLIDLVWVWCQPKNKKKTFFLTLHKFIDFLNQNPWLWLVWMSCAGSDDIFFFFLGWFLPQKQEDTDSEEKTSSNEGGLQVIQKFLELSINKEAPRPPGTIAHMFSIENTFLWHERMVTYTMYTLKCHTSRYDVFGPGDRWAKLCWKSRSLAATTAAVLRCSNGGPRRWSDLRSSRPAPSHRRLSLELPPCIFTQSRLSFAWKGRKKGEWLSVPSIVSEGFWEYLVIWFRCFGAEPLSHDVAVQNENKVQFPLKDMCMSRMIWLLKINEIPAQTFECQDGLKRSFTLGTITVLQDLHSWTN